MACEFVKEPVGSELLGASLEPEEVEPFRLKELGEDKEGVSLGMDRFPRDGGEEFLIREGRKLFGEAKEDVGRAVIRGKVSEFGVLKFLDFPESLTGPGLVNDA